MRVALMNEEKRDNNQRDDPMALHLTYVRGIHNKNKADQQTGRPTLYDNATRTDYNHNLGLSSRKCVCFSE